MSNLLTVKDVADVLQCSEDAVTRRFAKMEGVIDLGKSTLGVRRYRVLRIPKAVVERYLTSKLPKTDRGRSVSIEVPERAERRRKSPKWEDRAIRNLAKAGLQNGIAASDKVTYRRIAERARLLTFVPQSRWHEVIWYDEEE
jgi:AraC-like DNA-binding protein